MDKDIFILNNKGQKLAASVGEVSGSTKLAVLLSGFLDSKDYNGMVGLAADLQTVGFTTIRFDTTGTWKSEGDISEFCLTQRLADVDSVIEFAKKNYGSKEVVLLGHSMGGRVAMLAGAKRTEAAAVVIIMSQPISTTAGWTDGQSRSDRRDLPDKPTEFIDLQVPYSFAQDAMRYKAAESLPKIHAPMLFIAGEKDMIVSPEKVKNAYALANEPKKFVIIPNIGHDYRHNLAEVALVNKEVLQFLAEQKI